MTAESLLILQEIAAELKDDPETLKSLSRILSYTGSYSELPLDVIVPTEDTEISPLLSDVVDEKRPFRDLRLRRLAFKNFRTFPQREYKPYAVKFENDKGPCSTFLVGRNGTGKSTIFDAIEYYYAHKVSNAEQKAIDDAWGEANSKETTTNIQKYLTFGFYDIPEIPTKDVLLEVRTQEGDKEVGLIAHSPICQPAPFCSDYDIANIASRKEGNLYDYIFTQLGYSELLDLQKRIVKISSMVHSDSLLQKKDDGTLDSEQVFLDTYEVETVIDVFMENYQQDSEKKNSLIDICDNYAKKTLDNFLDEILTPEFLQEDLDKSERLFRDHWKQLQENAKDFVKKESITLLDKFKESISARITAQKLIIMYDLLHQTLIKKKGVDAFNLFINIKKMAEQHQSLQVGNKESREKLINLSLKAAAIAYKIQKLLDAAINNVMGDFVEQYKSFIESSLAYFSDNNETFQLNYSKQDSNVYIKIYVTKSQGSFKANPNEYLNSFRFKLYAIALKLSLAFWYMKKNRCILPIAIDDVFNANDFENSGRLQQFVHKIYQAYHDKVNDTIPLQVIVLTHDEMILNAFRKGFNVREISRWGESEEERKKSKQTYNLYSGKCIVGRLFPYWEAQKVYIKIHKGYLSSDILNLYIPLN